MEIGKRIKEERIKLALTQKDLSERAGLSASYVSDIEVGRTSPSLKSMEKLSKALNVKINELL